MSNPPTILFRYHQDHREEIAAATRHFPVKQRRTECFDQVVVPRYSALPYYRELEADLQFNGCSLINTFRQHNWVASFDYYQELADLTFPSWGEDAFARADVGGAFVVKGKTNSRKSRWNTHMYAPDRSAALRIASELREDPLIGDQGLVFRQYVPLKTFEVGINGQRFCNEWRLFYLGTTRLAYGYYWSIADDVDSPRIDEAGLALADLAAARCAPHVPFFALDVAEKEDGSGWVVVEVNDGQMSGLSMIDPDEFYGALARELTKTQR